MFYVLLWITVDCAGYCSANSGLWCVCVCVCVCVCTNVLIYFVKYFVKPHDTFNWSSLVKKAYTSAKMYSFFLSFFLIQCSVIITFLLG